MNNKNVKSNFKITQFRNQLHKHYGVVTKTFVLKMKYETGKVLEIYTIAEFDTESDKSNVIGISISDILGEHSYLPLSTPLHVEKLKDHIYIRTKIHNEGFTIYLDGGFPLYEGNS